MLSCQPWTVGSVFTVAIWTRQDSVLLEEMDGKPHWQNRSSVLMPDNYCIVDIIANL
jgi:hypothetical protein